VSNIKVTRPEDLVLAELLPRSKNALRSVMSYNLLFVCTGNTCRSPMAEALARHALRERGWSEVDVASAGRGGAGGSPASPEVPDVLAELGIESGHHRPGSSPRSWWSGPTPFSSWDRPPRLP
jgi:hypothetical protein